jgi:CheY-like chemotaxis protein
VTEVLPNNEANTGTMAVSGPAICDRSRVLLVDDDDAIRALFRLILSTVMPEKIFEEARNGQEAIDCFSRGHHAVLLMDLHMPVMDGQSAFNAIERLCRQRQWELPSFVFCTGFAPPESVAKVVENSSMHCLLLKPVSSEVLVNTVRIRLAQSTTLPLSDEYLPVLR